MPSDSDDGAPAFPKPVRVKKPPKGLNQVRPAGKRTYNAPQRARSSAAQREYQEHARPGYLLNVARQQGRLRLRNSELPGTTERQKLKRLSPEHHPVCEMRLHETGCDARPNLGLTVHHRRGRQHVKGEGPGLTDTRYFVACCMACHEYVETHRAWAYEHGWLERRNAIDVPPEGA